MATKTPPAKGGAASALAAPTAAVKSMSADPPAQLAKAALRRLALDKLEPTPDNYARAYQLEQGGAPPAALPERAQRAIERVVARGFEGDAATSVLNALVEGDWERAERCGPPGWDWFHFIIQRAVLVERRSVPELTALADALLASPPFRSYAERSGISGTAPALFAAYLMHCIHVVRQADGRTALEGLLAARV